MNSTPVQDRAEPDTKSARSVVIVSAVDPYPADSGKKVVLSGFVDYWLDRLGEEDVHYVLVRPGPRPAPEKPSQHFPGVLHEIVSPSTADQLRALVTGTMTGRASIQESMLKSSRVRRELRGLLATIDADVEIYDTVRLGQYAKSMVSRVGRRRVIYLDDLFSQRYRVMLTAAQKYGDVLVNPLGAFGAMIPAVLRRPVNNPMVQRTLLRVESHLVGRAERAATRDFDRCLLVNDGETRWLSKETGAENVRAVPPLIRTTSGVARSYDGRPEFVFLGLLSLPHNDDGIRWFLDHAMRPLLALRPEAKLRIVGREATAALQQSAARFPGSVTLEGYVPDLDALLTHTAALLTPLRFGSGVKIKPIEAMARGVPVVSTGFGVDGIVDGPDQGVVLVDDIDAYAPALLELMEVSRNVELSDQARTHFESTFSKTVVFDSYDDAF